MTEHAGNRLQLPAFADLGQVLVGVFQGALFLRESSDFGPVGEDHLGLQRGMV